MLCAVSDDMVVEVITESLDVGDVFVAALGSQVSREQNCKLD